MIARDQVASNLGEIRNRIAMACDRAGRKPEEITILGASKSQPVERLKWAWDAGLRVFGENRVQEALSKMPELPPEIEWHLIGPLQSNKVKKAVPIFNAVHSIDRVKIARALDRTAAQMGRSIVGFIEINLAEEESKHGFTPSQLMYRLADLSELEALSIEGLMAIPPFQSDPEASRTWFRRLRELRDKVFSHPDWSQRPGYLSMGMSYDYNVAVEEGATHVRIGSSLFGPRVG